MKTKIIPLLTLIAIATSCSGKDSGIGSQTGTTPNRIVSLAPNITEILFAIGAGDKVVGVTTYCNYPPEATKLPKIGEFRNVDFEKIVSLKPDLIIGTKDGNPKEVIDKLRSLGMRVETFQPVTIPEICETIEEIGKLVGEERNAQVLCTEIIDNCTKIVKDKPTERVNVLLLYGDEPLVAAGEGTLGDEMIRRAGGRNVMGSSSQPYVATNFESIISKSPDVILELTMGSEDRAAENVKKRWEKWQSIPAVRNKQIYLLDPDLVCRPGPRVSEGLRLVAEAIRKAAQVPESLREEK